MGYISLLIYLLTYYAVKRGDIICSCVGNEGGLMTGARSEDSNWK